MVTKEQIRKWTQQRWAEKKPLPTQDEIRRQLGFQFNAKKNDCPR